MKVLFVGEGPYDIGAHSPNLFQPRLASGPVTILSRRVCPSISQDSVAIGWTQIPRFLAAAKKRGYVSKVKAAVLLAQRFSCKGCVFVADRDRDLTRIESLREGVEAAKFVPGTVPMAYGVAVESCEAWTLAVPEVIAEVLSVAAEQVRNLYPSGMHIESLYEKSGKPENRPKSLLEAIAKLKGMTDMLELREMIAEKVEIAALENVCKEGFAPFAKSLRMAFG